MLYTSSMRQFPKTLLREFGLYKKMNTPAKIQDFLNTIPFNFEPHGSTCRSPREVLKHKSAHCLEGALLAASILWYHGKRPLLLDLGTPDNDTDHVVTLFKQNNHWGALSKTNHAVLRYRDPIYKTVRELVMSYFNEYFIDSGAKTLRRYSKPFDVLQFEDEWLTSNRDMWNIEDEIIRSPHISILNTQMIHMLRRADNIEIQAGKIVEYTKQKRRRS